MEWQNIGGAIKYFFTYLITAGSAYEDIYLGIGIAVIFAILSFFVAKYIITEAIKRLLEKKPFAVPEFELRIFQQPSGYDWIQGHRASVSNLQQCVGPKILND